VSTNIIDLLRVDRRYQRSVHLERDFTDPSALVGYVPTSHIEEMLIRIIDGLDQHPNRRAFRLTGNYGMGKSSFALLLAHLLQNGLYGLPHSLRSRINVDVIHGKPRLLPVLVTGSREPINVAVLRSLLHTLQLQVDSRAQLKVVPKLFSLVRGNGKKVTDDIALNLIQEINCELIAKERAKGLLIILDELGKFLEFAALNPERQDIFFLQRLAELSCRSGLERILFVGLLHQNFSAYAHNLTPTDQREWEKVAGRFDEIVFSQPPEQVVRLIGAALNVRQTDWPKQWEASARECMKRLADGGWFGPGASMRALVNAAPELYPVHPSVVPALVRFFSSFGQNERSLFSFLLSNEAGGLQEFAQTNPPSLENCYRLHHFFDYVAANYGDKLGALSLQNHWNHISAAVCSLSQWPEKAKVAKTVGILNLLQRERALVPTEAILPICLADSESRQDTFRDIIRALKKEDLLYFRGKSGGYCLWSHTSVNLHERFQEADRSLTRRRVSDVIQAKLDTRPLVARRHYIETGNLRSFEILYCSPNELELRAKEHIVGNDCRILIPLCETDPEQKKCIESAKKLKCSEVLIGIPQPLSGLDGYVQELERCEWVKNNTPELKDDNLADQEVRQKVAFAKDALERRVQHFVGLRHSDTSTPLRWFRNGEEKSFESGQQFLSWLSDICEDLFPKAPRVRNELINRRSLSSAAARARMKLIELMFKAGNQRLLGMSETKRPPEMSMYFSVLQNTEIHRLDNGVWTIDFPKSNDPANLLPALEAVKDKLQAAPDSRVLASDIFHMLRSSPYGVRDGLLPLLLVVVLLKYHRDIALYENGTFLSEIAHEEILRLSKVPHTFALQWCHVGGLRLSVFERLLGILGAKSNLPKKAELLDVVKPLMSLVAGLPPYARNTKALSPKALAVRDVLLNAGDPTVMLFQDLPKACGFEPLSSNEAVGGNRKRAELFVDALRISLDELRSAFPELLARISAEVRQVFHLDGAEKLSDIRERLVQQSSDLANLITDIELKGFCLRLADKVLDDGAWLEALGSFIAATPPSRWKNQDEHVFTERLHYLTAKFMRTEAAAFSSLPKNFTGQRILVTLTHPDGTEKSQVIHLTDKQLTQAETLKKEIESKLLQNTAVDIHAMSQLTWDLLDKKKRNELSTRIRSGQTSPTYSWTFGRQRQHCTSAFHARPSPPNGLLLPQFNFPFAL